jgi:hypothetical protein
MTAAEAPNVPGQADPDSIPQFNWRQLAAYLLLPVAWWFILLYGIAPLLLPAFSAPNGEPNGWLLLSIQVLGYLFEFSLALSIFRKEGYALRLRALRERIHWHWPRGWRAWGIILILFVVGFGLSQLLQPLSAAIASVFPPPDWFPASQHPFKEVNSVQDALPGLVFRGNVLFLLLVLFSGTMNIVGEDLYYRGALIPKLRGLFGGWAWLAGGIIWLLKHIYVWWRFIGDAGALGIVGAYIFGPMGSLPVTMLVHLISNYGLSWPLVFQAVFGGG